MLALLSRLKHVRDNRHLKFLQELLELSVYIAWFSDVVNQDHWTDVLHQKSAITVCQASEAVQNSPLLNHCRFSLKYYFFRFSRKF